MTSNYDGNLDPADKFRTSFAVNRAPLAIAEKPSNVVQNSPKTEVARIAFH
jgi:hypothetical protein